MKKFDNSYLRDSVKRIAGVDEAGRGPLAGPVVAAAVMFENDYIIEGVNDSKKLSEKKRESLYELIINGSLAYGIGIVDHNQIDKINILQASLKAMKLAVDQLKTKPDLVLIDGNKTFYSEIEAEAIVKGDSKSFAIAAASIIAKVTRDRIMYEASRVYPQYLWNKNKGYATREHIEAIQKYGPTNLHRKTFLSNILPEEELSLL